MHGTTDDEYCYFLIEGSSYRLVQSMTGLDNGDYEDFKFYDGSSYQQPSPDWAEFEEDEWSRIEIRFDGTTTATLVDVSDGTSHTIDLRNSYSSNSLDIFVPIYSNRYRAQTLYTDDIYVRKYCLTDIPPMSCRWRIGMKAVRS